MEQKTIVMVAVLAAILLCLMGRALFCQEEAKNKRIHELEMKRLELMGRPREVGN